MQRGSQDLHGLEVLILVCRRYTISAKSNMVQMYASTAISECLVGLLLWTALSACWWAKLEGVIWDSSTHSRPHWYLLGFCCTIPLTERACGHHGVQVSKHPACMKDTVPNRDED